MDDFVREQLIARGFVSATDVGLYTITNSCDEAAQIIDGFYANYDSIRLVGDQLIVRMRQGPTTSSWPNSTSGSVTSSPPGRSSEPAVQGRGRDDDKVNLDRISLVFAKRGYSDLIEMIASSTATSESGPLAVSPDSAPTELVSSS